MSSLDSDDDVKLDDDDTSTTTSSPSSSPPPRRVLYDVFFHEPGWSADADLQSPSSPSVPDVPAHYYEVSEADYLAQRIRSYAHSLTTREQLRRSLVCCTRRRQTPSDPQTQRREEKEADLREGLNDDSATATGGGIHWPLYLSGSGHLLAVLTDSALILRTALTQFAYADVVRVSIPPYIHSRSPYPSSQPSSHLFSSPLHPYSYIHSRPAAWFGDSLLAVAVRDDAVNVYDVDPLTLDHNSSPRTSVRLILHFALTSAQSPLEQSGGVGLLVGRGPKQWPTIAALTWREAACQRTVEGKCPHLLVLTYDGGVHHVHVPTQPPPLAALSSASPSPSPSPSRVAFDARVPPHAPPTSDRAHSRSSSIVTPKRPSPAGSESSATSLNAVIRKRFELQHTRAASSSPPSSSPPDSDDMRREVVTFSGVPLRHGYVAASAPSAEDGKGEADDAQRLAKAGDGVRRRKQPRDSPSQDSSTSSEPLPDDSVAVAFTAMAFNVHTSTLIVVSISLSPDRSPQLSYWTVTDNSPQPFLHRFTTPYLPPSISHVPVPRLNPFSKALHSVWKRVKVTVGASPPPDDGLKPYEPTLSDLTSSLLLAPAGRRVLLLDVQGNINVWEADGDGAEAEARLIHTVRRAQTDGPRGDLLCQVSWWDDDDLVQGYTDGRLILTPLTRTPSASPSLSIAPTVPSPPPVNLLGQVEVVAGIPFLSPTIPAETFTPPFRSLPTLELPHRVFILSCHRRFQRQRRVWAHLDRPEETDALYDPEVISMQSTFRLLSLCESSPAKFLNRKVELHQWEDAMQVADLYALDPDEVWKERWKAAEVNADSIQQLLARVKDRWWVLHQCATRSCDAVDNRRQLLDYGLTLTSFRAVSALSPSVASQGFTSAMPAKAGEGALDEEVDASALDALQLTGEQVRMCLYRLLFVQYVQRLETFHILQHSSTHHDASVYPLSAMPYTAFLTCDLTAAACDLARDENFQALEALLRLHTRELFTHRLDIVDEVPLTCEPALYQQLLPLSTTLPPTSDERTGVWVFQRKVLQQLAAVDVTQTPLSTQHVKWLLQQDEEVSRYHPDVAALTAWYLRRSQRMDVETGDLQRVSSLCSLVAEKDSVIGEGLQAYRMALEDVSVLVYAYDMDVSVAEWEHMDSMQRLKRVLEDSSEDTVVHDVLTKGGVVLQRTAGDASAQRLLVRFLCDCVRTDLRLVRGLVNGASSQLSSLIPTNAAFVDEVVNSLYTSPRHDGDSLRVIESILAALPARGDVQGKRDRLQQHLTADLILDRHQVGQPLSFFTSLQVGGAAGEAGEKVKAECVHLFHHLCRKAIQVKPPLSDKQWSELLSDLLTLRGLVFPFMSLESCYTQCVESMLAAGRFKLGKRALRQLTGLEKRDERQKAAADAAKGRGAPLSSVASTFGPSLATSVQHVGLLPLPVAEELVLQVAREFLLSSASVDHPSLALANECLHILPLQALTDSLLPAFLTSASSKATSLSSPDVTARWQQELDFIEGLSRLSALNVSIIPIQLRTSSSPLSFISHLLEHNSQAYRDDEAVMDIARLFGCASDEAQAEGRLLLLKAAIKAGDVDKAYQMCLGLLEERRFKAACESALEMAQMEGVRTDRAARTRLISNATWACDIDRLEAVLEQWKAATVKPLDVATFLSAWEAEAKMRAARASDGEEKEMQEGEDKEESWEGTGTEVDRLIQRVVQQELSPPPPSSAPSLLAYTLLPSKPAPATTDALLLAQVEATYQTDAALALSYLLTLSSSQAAFEWVQGLLAGPLSRSSRAALVSLAFRYSALLSLAAPHPFPLPEQLNVVVADAQLLDVSEDLLQQQVDVISQLYHSSPSSPPPDVITRALHYAGLRSEALKAEQVLAQFPGLDLERFTRDAQYRYDTVLSLVQSPDAEQMSIALPLATRYGLPTTTMYIERLKWLLRSTLSLQAVETEVQGWTPQLMTSPRETYAALDALYPLIDGRDLERFRFLVGLADGCLQAFHTMTKERPFASSPRKAAVDHSIRVATDQLKTHRQVLVLLIRAHLKVDYHHLLDRAQVEAVVSEVVEEPNVLMLQGLADRLNQLIAAPSPLPPFPALPTPSSPTATPPPPLSPSFNAHPAYVTAALIWRQFLSKSLKRCLSSPSASLEDWFDTEPPTPLRTGTRFRALSLIDACQLLVQAASLSDAPPPFTAERLLRHLTLVELGLRALPVASPTAAAADANRSYDAVIGLQEKLRVLVSASQLPSLVSTSYFDQLCRGSQWRETVGSLMLRGQEAGVQVKDVKELIDLVDSQRTMQADSYRQPPPAGRWSVESLASELLAEELSSLSQWEQMPTIKACVPSLAALVSPAWLCALCLEDGERSGALRRLHSLLVNYWTQPLPAEAMSGDASSMAFLLLVKALDDGEHHSLPPPPRESLRADKASMDTSIVHRHLHLLERLLQSAVHATEEGAECTAAQWAAVKALYEQAEGAVPAVAAPSVFASFNVCALLAALWEWESLIGGPTRTTARTSAQWKVLSSLLIAFDHPSLLLDVWRRRVNAALDEEEQRQLCKEAAASPSQALQTAALVLGFSSRHLSIREDATSAALDRPSAAAEKDPALLTAIATSDQLPSFARSSLFPGLSTLLLQHSRASPPSPTATAMAAALHRLLGCAECEKRLLAGSVLVHDWWLADGWSLAVSLAYLVRKGFHSEAVSLLFSHLQTVAALRTQDVGLELLKHELTDAAKKARKEASRGGGAGAAAVSVYDEALQCMEEAQLVKPVSRAQGQQRVAQPVNPSKASRR